MYRLADSPVKEVTFGDALNLSLDHYYDLLKNQVGGLAVDEFLQLKLVADVLDLSDKSASSTVEGYKWHSYYRLLERSDQAISPTPISGTIQTANADLTDVYGKFLLKLRQFVVQAELSAEDQKLIADLDKELESIKNEMMKFAILDRKNWKDYAEAFGYQIGDITAYVQWSGTYGHLRDIENKMREQRSAEFKKKTILDRQFPEPDDRAVVDAEFDFENPTMRIRYPIIPDYDFPNGHEFNVSYLALLPLGSSAQFDDRRVVSWDKTLTIIKTTTAGSLTATLDQNTEESSTIETDWKASSGVKYGFLHVNANAEEHKKIKEDFKNGLKLTLNAKAAFKVGINFPGWFNPTLFEHRRVKENIHDFEEFFGKNGSLRFYPTQLIIVRGFDIKFESSQDWTFDYKKQFSASGGGGFKVFGINFGSTADYGSKVTQHEIDQSGTKFSISDGADTLRFVGYSIKENKVFEDSVATNRKNNIPDLEKLDE